MKLASGWRSWVTPHTNLKPTSSLGHILIPLWSQTTWVQRQPEATPEYWVHGSGAHRWCCARVPCVLCSGSPSSSAGCTPGCPATPWHRTRGRWPTRPTAPPPPPPVEAPMSHWSPMVPEVSPRSWLAVGLQSGLDLGKFPPIDAMSTNPASNPSLGYFGT